jgi:hypothetical protein
MKGKSEMPGTVAMDSDAQSDSASRKNPAPIQGLNGADEGEGWAWLGALLWMIAGGLLFYLGECWRRIFSGDAWAWFLHL